MGRKQYIGFVIDNCVPTLSSCLTRKTSPRGLIIGTHIDTSVAQMRFRWIADEINNKEISLHYELYRPWRKYTAVIFLKSMGQASIKLAHLLKNRGVKIIFDANVDYFTPASGEFYYQGMAPTEEQTKNALEMADLCDAVIGDSKHIADIASSYNDNTGWIPDNVRDDLISPIFSSRSMSKDMSINLFWSGEAVKLFELLLIKDILIKYAKHFHLVVITNSLRSLDKWYGSYKKQFVELLDFLSFEFLPFKSVGQLMNIYDQGGFVISPRHLNNTYNLGHTEWKITLGMARGLIALGSPQPSYLDLYDRADGRGIRICENEEGWAKVFEEVVDPSFDWPGEAHSAIESVKNHYATSVIARSHSQFVSSIIDG